MTRYRAKLSCVGKSSATTPIEAQDREGATSAAIEWAHGQIAGGHPAPASLFLEIDGQEWLIPRWQDHRRQSST